MSTVMVQALCSGASTGALAVAWLAWSGADAKTLWCGGVRGDRAISTAAKCAWPSGKKNRKLLNASPEGNQP